MNTPSDPALPRRDEALIERIWAVVDPRLRRALAAELETAQPRPLPLGDGVRIALVGHRAAGKSRLAPLVGEWVGWPAVDLDAELEAQRGRRLSEWVPADEEDFRRAERELFEALPGGRVVAVGGGFLSHHPDALEGQVAVLVPITLESYRERLLADASRPRLRPELTLSEELDRIYQERERRHARVPSWSLPAFLGATRRGPR
ncbi:MAG: shikimate kinase [Myxococcales bacterium]